MAKYSTLTDLFTAIATSLRSKTGTTGKINADDFPTVIDSLSTGGITPTGRKTIDKNGIDDVTAWAEVDVQVPIPDPICVTRQITLSTDQGNGTATSTTVLTGDDFIKAHYSDPNLSITMIPLFTPVAENNAVQWIWHGNKVVSVAKSSYYGFAIQSAGTGSGSAALLNTTALTGTTYSVGFKITSAGEVQLKTRAASIVKAGNYMLILTCD